MSILIYHKFVERLSTFEDDRIINVLIIGTFNPGPPVETLLTENEKVQFSEISDSKKYQDSSSIRNFYDRSKNRFWKVMDVLKCPAFYSGDFNKRNPNGLKFYLSGNTMNRNEVYLRQDDFCKTNGIFITDLVKSITPKTFKSIYDNFPDTIIEKSSPSWNTNEVLEMITKYSISKVLVNFDFKSKSTPKINEQIRKIQRSFPNLKIVRIMSPSGAAGNSVSDIYDDWKKHILILNSTRI